MIQLVRKNRWSTISILITAGDAVLIFAIVRYLYWRGVWETSYRAHSLLSVWGGLSVLFSLLTAALGVRKDASKGYSFLALGLSLISFLFYVH